MKNSQRENLERAISSVEDVRITVEELQDTASNDKGSLSDVVNELKRIEDDLDAIDADHS